MRGWEKVTRWTLVLTAPSFRWVSRSSTLSSLLRNDYSFIFLPVINRARLRADEEKLNVGRLGVYIYR